MATRNVKVESDDKAIHITIPLAPKEFRPSSKGKSILIGSTGGGEIVDTLFGACKIAVNAYIKVAGYTGPMAEELIAESQKRASLALQAEREEELAKAKQLLIDSGEVMPFV